MTCNRTLDFSKIAPYKEKNIEYILNNSWESILKDQLHKITSYFQFHRSLESEFFMDVIATMIAAEIVSRVKPYRGEKVSINDGMLHYKFSCDRIFVELFKCDKDCTFNLCCVDFEDYLDLT